MAFQLVYCDQLFISTGDKLLTDCLRRGVEFEGEDSTIGVLSAKLMTGVGGGRVGFGGEMAREIGKEEVEGVVVRLGG